MPTRPVQVFPDDASVVVGHMMPAHLAIPNTFATTVKTNFESLFYSVMLHITALYCIRVHHNCIAYKGRYFIKKVVVYITHVNGPYHPF